LRVIVLLSVFLLSLLSLNAQISNYVNNGGFENF